MFIQKICISGFKNYQESVVFEFNNYTEILARNAQGKSSISEAIAWGLYGCDISGDSKADSKLKNVNSDSMYVIIDFEYNGQNNRIVRKKSKSLTLKLNDEKITEKQLLSYLPDKDLFLAIFNPKHFLSYSMAKQRSLILKMIKVSYEDVSKRYALKDDSLKEIIESYPNLNTAIQYYINAIKNTNSSIENQETKLSVYENLIVDNSCQIPVVETFSKEEEKLLSNLQLQLNKQNFSEDIISTENLRIELNKAESDLKFEKLNTYDINNAFTMSISDLNKSINDLNIRKNIILKEYSELKESNFCPKCKQIISDEYKETELNSLQHEIDSLDSQINMLEESISILEAQNEANKQLFIDNQNKKINDLTSLINLYKDNIAQIEKSNQLMKNKYSNDEQLISEIESLKTKQSNYINYKARIDNKKLMLDKYNSSLTEIKEKILSLKQTLADLEIQQSKLKNYNSLYVEYVGEILTSWLNRTSINLFNVVKATGEIKDTFDIKYDNKPLRLISNSEYTRAALELSEMFNSSLNLKIPIFVDDAESIIDIPTVNTQMLVARVQDCDLKIINYDTKNKYPEVQSLLKEPCKNKSSNNDNLLIKDTSIYAEGFGQQLSF